MLKLRSALIEITSKCNLGSCVHCSSESRPDGEAMSPLLLRTILNMYIESGVQTIEVSGGEPLTALEHVLLILEHAREHNIKVKLFTNGILLQLNETLYSLRPYRDILEIHVALHGPNALLHEMVTNCDGSFHQALAGAVAAVGHGFDVRINTVLHKYICNERSLESLVELCDKIGAEQISFLRLVPHGRAKLSFDWLSPKLVDYMTFYKWVAEVDPPITIRVGCPLAHPKLVPKSPKVKIDRHCSSATSHLTWLPDATVLPCVAFKGLKHRFALGRAIFLDMAKLQEFLELKHKIKAGGALCVAQALYLGRDPLCILEL